MVLWRKLSYYGENYGTILLTIQLWFSKEKQITKSYETFFNNGKNYGSLEKLW